MIYTDNGSNFVSAKRDLAELRDFINSRVTSSEDVANLFSTQEIKWHFPLASHSFRRVVGISMKTLLRKTIGAHILTFRELNTVLIQTEQVLNSTDLWFPLILLQKIDQHH